MNDLQILTAADLPLPLREIPSPPKKLYLAGVWPAAEKIFLTVVGTRKHTVYGEQVCRSLLSGLAGYPIVIVSGLALGIDGLAHQVALESGLTTLAFPGSGLSSKTLYPAQHRNLAEKIIAGGGGLVSEYEPEQRAAPWTFPQRNRLMAGLARAVLVIEAERPSGTLITSRLATEYNRDVLAVPGSIFSPASRGPNWLLSQGATPISASEDLLRALGFEVEDVMRDKKELEDLPPDEKTLLNLLRQGGSQPRDLLIGSSGLETRTANAALSVLEIKGLIAERGGMFCLM